MTQRKHPPPDEAADKIDTAAVAATLRDVLSRIASGLSPAEAADLQAKVQEAIDALEGPPPAE